MPDGYTTRMADLNRIIRDLEEERLRIDAALAALKGIMNPNKTEKTKSATSRGRTLSAEARKRIADAQRKRWAKVRKTK